MEKTCFVLQPFDNDKFDKRYKEIIEPVIKECGLVSYRVDEDCASVIPIESIHTKIRESIVCIAEITTDNPNVWYELGYALALEKNVIILCSEERTTLFPFDIRHRNILVYKTQTISDFQELKNRLKNRINAYLSLDCTFTSDILDNVEINILRIIWYNQNTPYEITSKDAIVKHNINNDEILNSLRKLISRKNIEFIYNNESGIMKNFYRLTKKGEMWIYNHENLIFKYNV